MARPVVSEYAERLYARLLPLAYEDESHDWPLLRYIDTIARMVEDVDDWSKDRPEYPGWHLILDVDNTPVEFLPWLGQFVGVKTDAILPGETVPAWEARQRDKIRLVAGFSRGTPGSIIAAVKPFLTGTQEVSLFERDTSPYHFAVQTQESETPIGNVAAITAAITAVKPAGLQFTYARVPDWTYNDIDAAYATYDAMDAANATYDDIDNGP